MFRYDPCTIIDDETHIALYYSITNTVIITHDFSRTCYTVSIRNRYHCQHKKQIRFEITIQWDNTIFCLKIRIGFVWGRVGPFCGCKSVWLQHPIFEARPEGQRMVYATQHADDHTAKARNWQAGMGPSSETTT